MDATKGLSSCTVANVSHWTIPTLLQEQISNIQLFCSALGRIDDVALANFTTTSSTVPVSYTHLTLPTIYSV